MQLIRDGLVRSHYSKIDIMCRILDVLLVAGGLLFSAWLQDYPWNPHFDFFAVVSAVLFYSVAKQSGLYTSWRTSSILKESGLIIRSWLTVMLIILLIAFIMKFSGPYFRRVMITWLAASMSALALLRIIIRIFLRYIRRRGRNTKTVAIGGAGDLGLQLANVILSNTWMGFKLQGFYDDFKPLGTMKVSEAEVDILGNLDLLVEHAKLHHIDLIYFTLPMRAELRLKQVLQKLADTTASVYIVPDMFTFGFLDARLVDMDGIPTISVYEGPFYGINDVFKYLEDLAIGTIILFFIMPLLITIAIAVKLSSPGPIIFKQRRYGFNGEEILIWKFRTMTVCEDGPDVRQAANNDPRITRLGEFLRRASLDELPQFLNVLQGRMSIVGPRPHAVAHNEYYRKLIPGYMLRHKVKPGITGWAQVNGWRGQTETVEKMQKRLEYDLYYIRNWSLGFDLRIIFRTIYSGFGGENAY
jgi:putative colanic acid biosysnthesis UDP-glucose lipid carrier transferase